VNRQGTYAEFVVVPVKGLLRIPRSMPFDFAAVTAITFGTAWHMLKSLLALANGESVLVIGAAGGLGSACVQVAKHLGGTVIGVASDAPKAAFIRALGADWAIDSSKSDFVGEVMRITNGVGVDTAVNHVGGATLQQTLSSMAPRGRVALAGGHAGELASIDLIPFFRRELVLRGAVSQTRSELRAVVRLVSNGRLRPHIERTLPLEQIAEAHVLLEERRVLGKIVIAAGEG
jgi:NADPH:quinone reductase-like Zn-dependent oxidoreductase